MRHFVGDTVSAQTKLRRQLFNDAGTGLPSAQLSPDDVHPLITEQPVGDVLADRCQGRDHVGRAFSLGRFDDVLDGDGVVHVASMSRGVAGGRWEGLKIHENISQHTRHMLKGKTRISLRFCW